MTAHTLYYILHSISLPLSCTSLYQLDVLYLNGSKLTSHPFTIKGPRSDVENYRTISLLPILSKILEKCVALKLVLSLSKHLHPSQHGFQAGRSCATQLVEVLYTISLHLDKGSEHDTIYLDFTKAFDSVCHAKILWKLKALGINGPLLMCFKNYLYNRTRRVVINGSHSSWAVVKSSVPQGSLLGPLLLLVYVNALALVPKRAMVAMFADDSKLFSVISTQANVDALQFDLDTLCSWSLQNELAFQPMKCENLRITPKKNSFDRTYYINTSGELKRVESQVHLGVTITRDLSWNLHIDTITAKANKLLGFLKRNCTKDMSMQSQKALYTALVKSHLGYCSQVWAPQSVIRNLLAIEKVQRKANKFLYNYSNVLSYRDRLLGLQLLPINYWLVYLDFVFFFKCKTNVYTIDLRNYMYQPRCSTRSSSSGNNFRQLTIPKTNSFRDTYFFRIVNLWNALPNETKLLLLPLFLCLSPS